MKVRLVENKDLEQYKQLTDIQGQSCKSSQKPLVVSGFSVVAPKTSTKFQWFSDFSAASRT